MNSKTKKIGLNVLIIIGGLGFLALYFYFYVQIKNHLKLEGQKQLMMLSYVVWTYCVPMLIGLFLSLPHLVSLRKKAPAEADNKVTVSMPYLIFTLFALLPVIGILDYCNACYGLNIPLGISRKLNGFSFNYELHGVLFGYFICHIWQKKEVGKDSKDEVSSN